MKPLRVLARIAFVGCLWSIIFIEGIRVIMLENWHFDIFWPPHWMHAWNLWLNGWVIDTAKEWAFILIIIAFIPLWLTGWITLSLIPWEMMAFKAVMYPINLVRSMFNPLKIVAKTPVVVKKKSYKEIRPTGPRSPIYDYNDAPSSTATPVAAATPTASVTAALVEKTPAARSDLKNKAASARETFSHSLFNIDDDDDDFDLDFDSFGKSSDIFKIDSKKNEKQESKPKDSRNNRFEFNEAEEDDEDYRPSRRDSKPRRNDDDDYDSRPRRKKYDDGDDDYDDRPRRRDDRGSRDNRDNDRRDARRDNRRRDDNRNKEDFRDKPKNNVLPRDDVQSDSAPRLNPVADVLTQKGYALISGATIKNTVIDFIGVSSDKICLCLLDKEAGDWLADEERFNDEEPLWFSENSHRISPVRKADVARQALTDKLEASDLSFEVKTFVIIQTGNIINAEDMFEVWNNMGIDVTRINRGMPKEIKLFSKTIEEAEDKPEKATLDTVKKLIRSLA